jgi:Protein of unknown function (DUF3096)
MATRTQRFAWCVSTSSIDITDTRRDRIMGGILFLQPLVALVAGILILIVPRILNYIVAIYLILAGLIGLSPHFMG